MKYEILIDDDDRGNAPAVPWCATLTIDGEPSDESGIGTTPEQALHDLLSSPYLGEMRRTS